MFSSAVAFSDRTLVLCKKACRSHGSKIPAKSFHKTSKKNKNNLVLPEMSRRSANHQNTGKKVLIPKTENQKKYLQALSKVNNDLIISTGPAGTGKTMLSCFYGIEKLIEGEFDKIVITRPAVTVDEDHGFLPGSIDQKLLPWLLPIYDYFIDSGVKRMIGTDTLEVCPLSHIRGRTFNRTFMIADEMQNSTCRQMKTLLTRVGENSRLIVTGDLNQCDLELKNGEMNGLEDFIERYRTHVSIKGHMDNMSHIEFDKSDVMRSEFVRDVIEIYGDE